MVQTDLSAQNLGQKSGIPHYTKRLLMWSFSIGVIPPLALILALSTSSLYLLDYVHVISGGTWTGFDIFHGTRHDKNHEVARYSSASRDCKEADSHHVLHCSFPCRNCDYRRDLFGASRRKIRSFFSLDNCSRHNCTGTDRAGIRGFHAKWTQNFHRAFKE